MNIGTWSGYRYTDAHVRSDPDLFVTLALAYLQDYAGDFDLLVSYQQRLQRGDSLTVPMIRAVLNCMRFDASVPEMPEPKVPESNVIPMVSRYKRFKLKPKPERPTVIDLECRWKMRYGISNHVQARSVHLVDPRSYIRYWTEEWRFECHLFWMCKTPWAMPKHVSIELLPDEAMRGVLESDGWKLCTTCLAIETRRNKE